jgi:hypothetical protein
MLEHHPQSQETSPQILPVETHSLERKSADSRLAEQWLEDYMDHIYAPLVGRLSYERRQEIRAEIESHLRQYIAAHQELGSTLEEATQAALRQYGKPSHVAEQWLNACQEAPPQTWYSSVKPVKPAFLRGVVALGSSITLWMLLCVLLDRPFMEPRPEIGATLATIGCLLPFVSGFLIGRKTQSRPVLGMLLAQAAVLPLWPLALTFLTNLLAHANLSYNEEMWTFGLGSFAVLAPIGCLGAFVGRRLSFLSRRRRLSAG